jgi:hypothetical protein
MVSINNKNDFVAALFDILGSFFLWNMANRVAISISISTFFRFDGCFQ